MLSIYFYLYIINMDIKIERLKMVELSILEEVSLLEENDYIFDSGVTKLIGSEFEGEVVNRLYCYQYLNGEVCGIVAFDNIYQSVYNVYTPKG